MATGGGVYGARDSHKSSNAQFVVKQYRAMASDSAAVIMIEGEVGKGVSAYSLVGALRAMLGKPANREADSKAFNNLKETRPLLQNLPTVTISRRGSHETPALSTLQQVDVVIDSMSYTSIAAGFRAQYIGAIISKLQCYPVLLGCRGFSDTITMYAMGHGVLQGVLTHVQRGFCCYRALYFGAMFDLH